MSSVFSNIPGRPSFDGDIRARAEAEKSEDRLVDWTDRLSLRTGANTSLGPVVSTFGKTGYLTKPFREPSLSQGLVQAMFMVVKQGLCTMVEAVTEMSFTGQRALWHAPTAVHWQQAYKQRKRFYLNRMNFRELMEKEI